MPKEHQSRREILDAIESLPMLADLVAKHEDRFDYELELEVSVYGRNYQGKKVGPYLRLLTFEPGETIIQQGDWGGNTLYIGVSGELDVFVRQPGGVEIKRGQIPPGRQFGEMSVLAGVPRAATVKAVEGAQVLEIQRPALRLLRKLGRFADSLDVSYHHHGRLSALQRLEIPPQLIESLVAAGGSLSHFRVFARNHVLFQEGGPIDSLYLIKEGWLVRKSKGETLDYLGKGHCFGLDEGTWPYTVTLLSRAEVLILPLRHLGMRADIKQLLLTELESFRPPLPAAASLRTRERQQQLIETGLTDATNLLVMDMDLCVRCGRCSLACHRIHGQSRLLRRGIAMRNLLAPAACLHCKDAECLTGCPTGAIRRMPDGQIDIDRAFCIGCGDCAVNCPYSAISMVPRTVKEPPPPAKGQAAARELFRILPDALPPAVEQTDDLLAVKCNLCRGTALNPLGASTPAYGCEENCPTGALARVPPVDYFKEASHLEGRAYADPDRGNSRNIHRRDVSKILIHIGGIVAASLILGFTGAYVREHGLDARAPGILTLRWITGLAGLVGIAAAMAYPWRRRVFRKRAGALRYWLLGHIYFGILGAGMIQLHSGSSSGGLLTTALLISFQLVILTGIWGVATYRLLPPLLTRIDEDFLLEDDLLTRRTELRNQLGTLTPGAERYLTSLYFLLAQFRINRTLEQKIEEARLRFPADSPAAIAAMVTMRRSEALILLHRAMKLWLPPHVAVTSLTLALMAVHILQVLYGLR